MYKNIKWQMCVLFVMILQVSFSNAAQTLKVEPVRVDFGTFNAFQIKETVVKLSNTGKETFFIDKIKADCSCIQTSISTNEIMQGKTIELKIYARRATGGKLSHYILIIPKDKEHYEPLKISVSGNVIEPVSFEVGWFGQSMKKFDPNGPFKLNPINQLLAKPVISITSNNKKLKLKDIIPDVNSSNFALEKYAVEGFSSDNQSQNSEKLVLTLKPKKELKSGALSENMKVTLKEDILLYITLSSRIVGNAYVDEQRISFGTFSDCEDKEITIYFTNNIKPWQDIKWSIGGDLSGVIDVSVNKNKCTDTSIVAEVVVDKSLLKNVPKGYNFSRLKFYQNDNNENNAVSVLVDGFN